MRYISVTITLLVVIGLAIWNCLRLGEAIFFWNTLAEFGAHPIYIAGIGAFWLAGWFFIGLSIWKSKSWAWLATIIGFAAYTIWYWIDRLALQEPHSNLRFALITNIISLIIIFSLLFSKKTRLFFRKDPYE